MPWNIVRARSAQSNAAGAVDATHHLRVAALVDAVLGPRAGIVLRARDLHERHRPRAAERARPVAVRVAGEVADDVLVAADERDERARVGRAIA